MKRLSLRRLVFVVIWLTALAPPLGALGYFLYANLLNPRATQQLTATYDGFYWDAAQLQIAYARLENQLLLYKSGADSEYSAVQLRYQVLQSKLNVMSGSTRMLAQNPPLAGVQAEEIRTLSDLLASLEPEFDALAQEPARAGRIVIALREHWNEVNDLALSRRFADVSDREALNHDFIAKRRLLFAAGLVLLLLSAAASVLLVRNGYRRTRLIRQQHAALAAEHEASRAAREASLAKDAFLGMISHELRTPLHAIVSSIELLGFNSHSEADRKVIRRLESAARQLEAQMKDLTDYARLGAGKLDLRHERFDPRELLASIADQNAPAASAKGLSFESGLGGHTGLVESDPHRIRQIVNNLVTNAIRYTERGSVRLELVQWPTILSIVVSDTGPGVPPAQLPLIFQEFTQLDASRTRRFEGAGMGLAIVQGLVDLFGGTIRVESQIGEGTTFKVAIPVTPVVGDVVPAAPAEASDQGTRPQILVIDDNPLVRESLCEMVAHMEYDAVAMGNADAALAWLDTHRCDVILLDLHMPDKDGYTFLEDFTVRHTPSGHVPIIAISAYAPEPDASGAAGPFFECLAKPLHYEVLRAAVQRALAARHRV
ncbi:signal transduction histidine kinase [Paraburkholderia sp. BL10I2N1]|nr:signal transduction histidine kinase [Paraburkholderia sp. BL10I2N1]